MTNFAHVMPGGYAFGSLVVGIITGGWMTGVNYGGIAVNTFNSKHEALPIVWARPAVAATAIGVKGWSKSARWTTIQRTTGLDTLDNKRWVCHGALWLPWDGVTTPTN